MERIRIVADSTADLSPAQSERYGIEVVPLTVTFGEQSFKDGVDLSKEDFYRRLKSSHNPPNTSQPSPAAFVDVYRRLAQTADHILSIHISARLSGTLNSAIAAATMVGARVTTVDTKTASQGVARSVLVAAEAARREMSLPQVLTVLRESIASTFSVFAVDTLEYLRRNGRIGRAAALLGSVLQLKPILYADPDGLVAAYDRVRGRSQVMPRLIAAAQEKIVAGSQIDVSVVHSGPVEHAEQMMAHLAKIYDIVESHIGMVGPAIGAHIGPGCLGLMIQPTFDVLAEMAERRQTSVAV